MIRIYVRDRKKEEDAQYSHKRFILNISIENLYPVVQQQQELIMIYDVDIKMFLFLLLMVHKMALDALLRHSISNTSKRE